MKAFKAGVHGVLRVSAYGCETTGELLCAILRVSSLTVSLQSPAQLPLAENQRLPSLWWEIVAALLAFVMLFYAMCFAWCLWRAFGLSADFGLVLSWAFSSVVVMDGNISLPSLFASFLLYNFRDVFGDLISVGQQVSDEALNSSGHRVFFCKSSETMSFKSLIRWLEEWPSSRALLL